jgi:glycerol uptake facilitator-like aquaporin
VSSRQNSLPLRVAAIVEAIATAFLLIAIVGSGIAAERLCGGNTGLALLANALATGAALFVLILTLGPISGAHMNPVVTIAAAWVEGFEVRSVPVYIAAQIVGAVIGVVVAHGMFDLPIVQVGTHVRTGAGQWLAEVVATVGLLGVIWGCLSYGTPIAAAGIAIYIGGAYWFTASTSFANPAVTIARSLTDTFAGIRPVDAVGFILAQMAALVIAVPVLRRLSALRSD